VSVIRTTIDNAVAEAIAEHPKYFTPKGLEHARNVIVRKVVAALRDGGEKPPAEVTEPVPPKFLLAAAESREARGYVNLRMLAGAVAPSRTGDGSVAVGSPANCDQVYALAELPPRDVWRFITDRSRTGAWLGFFRDMLPDIARRTVVQERDGVSGILMPWPWPPSKDGKIYDDEVVT
jgi:hypothetical protein